MVYNFTHLSMLKWTLHRGSAHHKQTSSLSTSNTVTPKRCNNITSVNKVVTFTETSFLHEDIPSVKKAFTFTETSFLSEITDSVEGEESKELDNKKVRQLLGSVLLKNDGMKSS